MSRFLWPWMSLCIGPGKRVRQHRLEIGLLNSWAYVGAFPSTAANGTIKEILLHLIANAWSKLGRCARERTILAVTGVGVILGGVRAHQGLTLLVSRGALPASTLQTARPISTALTIRSLDISGTGCIGARTLLCRVTATSTGSADSVSSSEMTAPTAIVIRVVADRIILEFARGRITTLVVAAACCTTTITVLTVFNNTITALMTCYGCDFGVIRQAIALNTVPSKR